MQSAQISRLQSPLSDPAWVCEKPQVVLIAAGGPDRAAELARTAAQLAVAPGSTLSVLHITEVRSDLCTELDSWRQHVTIQRVVDVAAEYGLPCRVETMAVRLDWPTSRRRLQVAELVSRYATETEADKIVVGSSPVHPIAKSVANHLRSIASATVVEVVVEGDDTEMLASIRHLWIQPS